MFDFIITILSIYVLGMFVAFIFLAYNGAFQSGFIEEKIYDFIDILSWPLIIIAFLLQILIFILIYIVVPFLWWPFKNIAKFVYSLNPKSRGQ